MPEIKLPIEGQEFYIDDGTLNGSFLYLYFKPGDSTASLDGIFNSAQLRAIADYMDKHSK